MCEAGSFLIDISKSSAYKLGSNVKLTFQVSQHVRDEQLLKSLIDYLDCGNYLVKRDVGNFVVTKFSDKREGLDVILKIKAEMDKGRR